MQEYEVEITAEVIDSIVVEASSISAAIKKAKKSFVEYSGGNVIGDMEVVNVSVSSPVKTLSKKFG